MKIRDDKWIWEVDEKILKDSYVKTNSGFKKATPQLIVKGMILRRATGGAVLFDNNGKEKEHSIFVHIDTKDEPFLMTINNKDVAWRVI